MIDGEQYQPKLTCPHRRANAMGSLLLQLMLEWHEYVLSHLTSLVNICDRSQLAIDQEPDVWIFENQF